MTDNIRDLDQAEILRRRIEKAAKPAAVTTPANIVPCTPGQFTNPHYVDNPANLTAWDEHQKKAARLAQIEYITKVRLSGTALLHFTEQDIQNLIANSTLIVDTLAKLK